MSTKEKIIGIIEIYDTIKLERVSFMKKEIKNFGKIVGMILIVLTGISLIINALLFTNMIYSCSYITDNLNSLLISKPFDILLWIDNILIYLFALLYIIDAIESKKEVLLKISFSLFSVFTTIIVSNFCINFVATIFGIF